MIRNITVYSLLIIISTLSGCIIPEHQHDMTVPIPVTAKKQVPSRKAADALPFLATFNSEMTLDDIATALGKPDNDCGSARYDLWYNLDDNSSIRVLATYQGIVVSIDRQGDNVEGYVRNIYKMKKKDK